jgi:hypothetical protein
VLYFLRNQVLTDVSLSIFSGFFFFTSHQSASIINFSLFFLFGVAVDYFNCFLYFLNSTRLCYKFFCTFYETLYLLFLTNLSLF